MPVAPQDQSPRRNPPRPDGKDDQPHHGWTMPIDVPAGYAYGSYDTKYELDYHTGTDFPAPMGTRVGSVRQGTVVDVGYDDGPYGNWVKVRHPNGLYSFYAHLDYISVQPGMELREGQKIGGVGTSGTTSTGAHLHFEIRDGDGNFAEGNFRDPIAFLANHGADVGNATVYRGSNEQAQHGGGGSGGGAGGGGGRGNDFGDYGYVSSFRKHHKQIANLIDQARAQGWLPEKLAYAIKDTAWWRNHTEDQRKWSLIIAESPAQAEKMADDAEDALRQKFGRAGVRISDSDLHELAQRAAKNGWDDSEMDMAVAHRFELAKKGGSNIGMAGAADDTINAMIHEWGVPVDRATRQKWIQRTIAGNLDPAQMQDRLREQAKVLYKGVADQLDTYSTRDLLNPYLSFAADQLGIPVEQMRTDDGKWTAALNGTDGSQMSMDEWTKTLRTDPRYGWDKGSVARQTAAQLTEGLAKMMGVSA